MYMYIKTTQNFSIIFEFYVLKTNIDKNKNFNKKHVSLQQSFIIKREIAKKFIRKMGTKT
jgi:hypothetical protein